MAQLYFRGRSVYSQYETPFIKAIGIGAVCTAIAVIVINVFGSRMVNLEVTAFVWLYSIVLAKLTDEKAKNHKRRQWVFMRPFYSEYLFSCWQSEL